MPRSPRIVVVGAGLTGLVAALALARARRALAASGDGEAPRVLLLEREPEPGGLCRSLRLDEVVFDLGPHVFFADDSEAWRFLSPFLDALDCFRRPFSFAIQRPPLSGAGGVPGEDPGEDQGRLFPFPNHADLHRYPWRYLWPMLRGLAGPKPPLTGEPSVRDEIVAKGGSCFYQELFEGFLTKKTLADPAQVHVHWLARLDRDVLQRESPPRHGGRLRRVLAALSRLRRDCIYPRQGFQAATDALHAAFLAEGGESVMTCGDIALEIRDNAVAGVRVQALGGETIPVRQMLWTAPLASLNTLLPGAAEADQTSQDLALDVALVFRVHACEAPPPRPHVYVYHPDPRLACNRTYYPHALFRECSPPGREGVCFEYTLSPELAALSDEGLMARAQADGVAAGLHPDAPPRAARVVRLPKSLPVHPLDYRARLDAALAPAHSLANLLPVGRQGGLNFCMTPGAVDQGIKAARHVAALLDFPNPVI